MLMDKRSNSFILEIILIFTHWENIYICTIITNKYALTKLFYMIVYHAFEDKVKSSYLLFSRSSIKCKCREEKKFYTSKKFKFLELIPIYHFIINKFHK